MAEQADFSSRYQPLNVFRGTDSVAKYYDPDENLPLPLVEIPDRLNPFREDGIRIYAKMLTALPAQNVKSLPALNMLRNEPSARDKSIVEASSGSTVLSLAMVSRVLWGNEDVTAHVTNKKHPDQLRLLRFFGLKTSLYGGLAQQEPTDPRGIMCRLRRLAKDTPGISYPGQYDNPKNWQAHEKWTGPQILRQLPEINVFCTTVGTGGCITGTGVALKAQKPTIKVVGVFNVFGDPTPGPRHFQGFSTCGFPWKDTVDELEEVQSVESYRMSMRLSREGLICGPSSGEALHGLLQYLGKWKEIGRLHELSDSDSGEISCVFTCSDLPYQYIDGYFQRLGEDEFPKIENEILLTCDQDRHDERWELQPADAVSLIAMAAPGLHGGFLSSLDVSHDRLAYLALKGPPVSGGKFLGVIDLRTFEDYSRGHIRQSKSVPLPDLTAQTGDIFGNPQLVYNFWKSLRQLFDENYQMISRSIPLLVLCYDGEASRLATSILRARGIVAYSVFGGFTMLAEELDKHKMKGAKANEKGIVTETSEIHISLGAR